MESKVRVNTTDELLRSYRDLPGKITIDVGDCAEGVLVEFVDNALHVSRAVKKNMGRVFDKDLYNAYHDSLLDELKNYSNSSNDALMDQQLRNSVTWNDPDYQETAYPPDLAGDLDGDGTVESTGDYIDVTRVVRGAPLSTVTLNSTSWSIVYLRTNRTDYTNVDGVTHAPIVYMRGNVKGRAVVVYDVSDDLLDPSRDRLHTHIMGDFEDPSDAPGNQIAAGGAPGVPGGIRYSDPEVQLSRTQAHSTQDMLITVCRGSISATGDTGVFKKMVRRPDNTPFDYNQQLVDLNDQYRTFYAATYHPDDLKFRKSTDVWNHNWPYAAAYGVYIGNQVNSRYNRHSCEGNFVPESIYADTTKYLCCHHAAKWNYFSPSAPGCPSDSICVLPLRFRDVCVPESGSFVLKGSASSLGSSLSVDGSANFDYRLQSMSPQDLRDAGLPLTVVVCSWQR